MLKPVHVVIIAIVVLLGGLLALKQQRVARVADTAHAVASTIETEQRNADRASRTSVLPKAHVDSRRIDATKPDRTRTETTATVAVPARTADAKSDTSTSVSSVTSVSLHLIVKDWSTSKPLENVNVIPHPDIEVTGVDSASRVQPRGPSALEAFGNFLRLGNSSDASTSASTTAANIPSDSVLLENIGPGQFRIAGLKPNSRLLLTLSCAGYTPLAVGPFEVPDSVDHFEKTVRMAAVSGLTGRLVEPGTHKPVADVQFALKQHAQETTASTGADGRFLLTELPSGTISVGFTPKEIWPAFAREFTTVQGITKDVGDIEVAKVASGIKGRVVRMPGEHPVPGVGVRLTKRDDNAFVEQSVTDEKGEFSYPNLSNGTYIAWLTNPYVFQQVTLGTEDQRELVLRIGGTKLRGHVTKGKQPLPAQVHLSQGATGYLKETAARTQEDGWFEVENVSAGWWLGDIYGLANKADKWNDWFNIPEQEVYEMEFAIPSGKAVGVVSDNEGRPVEGARVYIVKNDSGSFDAMRAPVALECRSQADGKFALEIRNGKFSLRASKPGVGDSKPIEVDVAESGESGPFQLKLVPTGKGTLRSLALDYADGQPIKAATLNLYDSASRIEVKATRDEDGEMLVEDLAAGTYRMVVSSPGYSVDERSVEIKPNETLSVESVLYEGGMARIVVQDDQGAFMPNVRVELVPEDSRSIEQTRTGITSRGGLFLVRGLTPGGYIVKAEKRSGSMQEEKLNIRAREITDWLMVLK